MEDVELCIPCIPKKSYKCPHNKQKNYCKDCGGSQICIHGKNKRSCKDCGGLGLCPHNKNKSYCKECGGSQICIHQKDKRSCKDCGGSKICPHNKDKRSCKDCGGSGICIHNKNKYYCKKCGNNSHRCEHNREKRYCVDCIGSAICEHKKIRAKCVDCKGSQLCEHNKPRTRCKECMGSGICPHKKIRSTCKECGGVGICDHGKRRSTCVDCKGGSICPHSKEKRYCKICDGSRVCRSEWCETTIASSNKYKNHCLLCFINLYSDEPNVMNYKTKEKTVVDRITETFTNFTWVADKKVQDGCSRRRPDLLLDMGSHIIIVEIDEKKHTVYDCSCENKRLMELSQDLQHRPIVFIRFNPDSYTNQNGILIKSCWRLNKTGTMQIMNTKQIEWEERISTLKEQIQYWIDNSTEKTIEIIQLYY